MSEPGVPDPQDRTPWLILAGAAIIVAIVTVIVYLGVFDPQRRWSPAPLGPPPSGYAPPALVEPAIV